VFHQIAGHKQLPDGRFIVPDVEDLQVRQIDQAAVEDIELRPGMNLEGAQH
jgi:hypothetical protein